MDAKWSYFLWHACLYTVDSNGCPVNNNIACLFILVTNNIPIHVEVQPAYG